MHLLLLSLNYYPDQLGNAPILVGIAEGLVERGHQVSVICAFPHHETGSVDPQYRGRLFSHQERHGVQIYRTFITPDRGGVRGKMLNYLSFSASSLWAALRNIHDVDLIFTPSPPITLGLVDITLRARFKAPYIYNLQDLFPEAAIRLGVLTHPMMIKVFQKMERLILTQADHLAVICEGFKTHAVDLGVSFDRVTVIPNFTDTTLIQPQRSSDYRKEWGLSEDDVVILFSGRMGYSQGLEGVVQAWRLLKDHAQERQLKLVMVGDGQAQAVVHQALKDDPRVILASTQPRARLSDLLAIADIGIAPLKKGLSGTSVPSKILGLMAAGRPVIAQAELGTDTASLIEDAQCGLITPPEDSSALAQAILSLVDDSKRRHQMGERGRLTVVDKYSESAVINAYEQLFLKVIEGVCAE